MAVPILPYYSGRGASAQHYDRLAEADRNIVGDIAVYAGLAEPPSRILELGAGTGRVAIDLAQRGHSVVGLDISAPMLAQAEAKGPCWGRRSPSGCGSCAATWPPWR
jgi:ubiquinone/menaquinone biosynthesis C-methylase UbiE